MIPLDEAIRSRFNAKWKRDRKTGCHRWTACLNNQGYGRFQLAGKAQLAHRVAYELFVGPIPPGHTIDHVRANGCRYRDCVNWEEHLEAVTHAVNIKRQRSAVTHCPAEHPYDEKNTYLTPQGGRACRICRREAVRRYQQRKHLAAA